MLIIYVVKTGSEFGTSSDLKLSGLGSPNGFKLFAHLKLSPLESGFKKLPDSLDT